MWHIRNLYTAAMWKDGKRTGSSMEFDSFQQAEDHLGTPLDHWPKTPVVRVRWNEKVPEDATGWVIEEARMKYAPELPLSGVRIYA
jgi:hypothetical protein